MNRNRFNEEVRPFIAEIPIGRQGVAFDRLELDSWVDEYIARNGRRCRASSSEVSGTSTSTSAGGAFAEALAQLRSKKRNAISQE
jgi:hypothetical protein